MEIERLFFRVQEENNTLINNYLKTQVFITYMSNKKKKNKREKKAPEYRSKEERQSEVKHVLEQLNEFQLNTKFEPVKKLYIKFKEYIGVGERLIVNIPFPEINRRIKGVLAINKREDVTIALLNEKF